MLDDGINRDKQIYNVEATLDEEERRGEIMAVKRKTPVLPFS